MPIIGVAPNFAIKFDYAKGKKNYFSSELSEVKLPGGGQNYLLDSNYGRSLVKNNKLSFTGVPAAASTGTGSAVISLSEKLSAMLPVLRSDDVILMGNELTKSLDFLKESIKSVPKVIKRVHFIEDKNLETTIAVHKNSRGFEEVINLSDEALKIVDRRDEPVFLTKGEAVFVADGDKIYAKGAPINIFYTYKQGLDDIRKAFVKTFDFSKYDAIEIDKLNIKHLERLGLKKDTAPINSVKFSDVGGQDQAISEIKRKIYYPIKNPNFFRELGASKSALFVGPPGNAKTLTAQALANELNVPFFNLNGQLLEGMHVGESAAKIHAYYEEVKKNQPCILFYDEIEAILGKRTGKHKYADDSVNMHLDEISKLEKENAEVYLIGATNRPELIDVAALRSKRFGTKIHFKNPDTVEKCKTILKIHTKSIAIDNLNLDEFATKLLSADVSGADIAEIASEAKVYSAIRQGLFEQMEKGTFVDKPNYTLRVSGEDFQTALDAFVDGRNTVESFANKSKEIRKNEIKEEMIATKAAKDEILSARDKQNFRIGYTSEMYRS